MEEWSYFALAIFGFVKATTTENGWLYAIGGILYLYVFMLSRAER